MIHRYRIRPTNRFGDLDHDFEVEREERFCFGLLTHWVWVANAKYGSQGELLRAARADIAARNRRREVFPTITLNDSGALLPST